MVARGPWRRVTRGTPVLLKGPGPFSFVTVLGQTRASRPAGCAGSRAVMTEPEETSEPTQEQVDKAREALRRPNDEENAAGTTRDVEDEPDTSEGRS
jgi:hypothetical protein